jgi:hypothetical protein
MSSLSQGVCHGQVWTNSFELRGASIAQPLSDRVLLACQQRDMFVMHQPDDGCLVVLAHPVSSATCCIICTIICNTLYHLQHAALPAAWMQTNSSSAVQ